MPSEPGARPSVTITTYATLKRLERQQQKEAAGANQEEIATRSELSTAFFRVELGAGAGAGQREHNGQRARVSQAERARVLVDLSQICGPTGSVRGHKNVVRRSLEGIRTAYSRRPNATAAAAAAAGLETTSSANCLGLASWQASKYSAGNSLFQSLGNSELRCLEYLERLAQDEQNLCVAYTTTLGVIRRTFEDSKLLKSILNLNLICFEERDIYLNQEYKFQLRFRLNAIRVPALFVDGRHIGGAEELERMNESGELQKLLAKFKMAKASQSVCSCCGNAKFIACPSCNGSRKSTIHHFKFNSIALRCIRCDKNDGLVMCPICSGELDSPPDENNNNNHNNRSSSESGGGRGEKGAPAAVGVAKGLELEPGDECCASKC